MSDVCSSCGPRVPAEQFQVSQSSDFGGFPLTENSGRQEGGGHNGQDLQPVFIPTEALGSILSGMA